MSNVGQSRNLLIMSARVFQNPKEVGQPDVAGSPLRACAIRYVGGPLHLDLAKSSRIVATVLNGSAMVDTPYKL